MRIVLAVVIVICLALLSGGVVNDKYIILGYEKEFFTDFHKPSQELTSKALLGEFMSQNFRFVKIDDKYISLPDFEDKHPYRIVNIHESEVVPHTKFELKLLDNGKNLTIVIHNQTVDIIQVSGGTMGEPTYYKRDYH